jgi:transcriptional regulator GlxA family with amidase domain
MHVHRLNDATKQRTHLRSGWAVAGRGRSAVIRKTYRRRELTAVEAEHVHTASRTTLDPGLDLTLSGPSGRDPRPGSTGARGQVGTLPVTLRRALAYLDDHVSEDVSVAQVAAACGVTVRALQLAFRRHLSTTPSRYLRELRLDRARRELEAGDPAHGDTVTEVAARWGFFSPGRFSAHYREAYGEPPSRTLAR